jgi:hypothetical protein
MCGGGASSIHFFLWGNLREGDYFEDLGVGGKIILKWIFRKWNGEAWAGLIWLNRVEWRAFVKAVMILQVP